MSARLLVIVLLAHASAAAAADLGRLFFTPEQRATLDDARKKNIRTVIGSDDEQQVVPAVTAAPMPQYVSIDGVVRRSDGKSTVWVNKHSIGETGAGGVKVVPGKAGDRVKLTVPDGSRSVDLRVGQTVEILSGRIEEGYLSRPQPKPAPEPADKPVAASAATAQPQTATPPPPGAPAAQKQNAPGRPVSAEFAPTK